VGEGGVMSALDEVRDLAESVTKHRHLVLWDVEMSGNGAAKVVRVLVDGDEGIDLDTVASVSEEISRGLDLNDPIPGRYTLEVSTPGLERRLSSPEHFVRCVGRDVVIKTRERLFENSHRIDGVIAEATEDQATVKTQTGQVSVPYEQIKSARTVFEWK
jgi:ribosome maturation factor RimP